VVLGGPDSANDTTPKMLAEQQRVKAALNAGVPYLGICLGLQIAVKVAGGKVVKSVKEVGLRNAEGTPYSVTLTDLALTALGKKDPLFVGLRNDFRVFQLHGETVEMTKDMQLLATGADCRNQIVKLAHNAYGIQSHFELTREMLADWLKADPDLSPLDGQKVMTEFETIEEVYTITGLSLLRNFLHIAGLIK
jgi:GMP synthase (glutamine-hydrolysing)